MSWERSTVLRLFQNVTTAVITKIEMCTFTRIQKLFDKNKEMYNERFNSIAVYLSSGITLDSRASCFYSSNCFCGSARGRGAYRSVKINILLVCQRRGTIGEDAGYTRTYTRYASDDCPPEFSWISANDETSHVVRETPLDIVIFCVTLTESNSSALRRPMKPTTAGDNPSVNPAN